MYVGGNLGYSWGKSDFSYSFLGTSSVGSTSPKGVLGGVGIGYNWQNRQLLLGVDADIQVTGQKADVTSLCLDPTACTRAYFNATQKLPWFGTLRGRLGFASASDWLLYVTGGLAWGQVKTETNSTVNSETTVFTNSASTTKVGWTMGGGVEKPITNKWTVKLEYLYLNLGTVSQTVPVGAQTLAIDSKVKDNILLLGVNLKF